MDDDERLHHVAQNRLSRSFIVTLLNMKLNLPEYNMCLRFEVLLLVCVSVHYFDVAPRNSLWWS